MTKTTIGPLVALIDYDTETTGFFADRPLSATVGEYELVGMPDGLVASGQFEPETPYFCSHESKKESGREGDPRGQVLAAMLAARERNAAAGQETPIFGAYVLGRMWFFLVLVGHDYAVSRDYSAVRDVMDIYRVLAALKKFPSLARRTYIPANSHRLLATTGCGQLQTRKNNASRQ